MWEKIRGRPERICAQPLCCIKTQNTSGDMKISQAEAATRLLLMAGRENRHNFIKCKGKEARTKQTKQELGEKEKE